MSAGFDYVSNGAPDATVWESTGTNPGLRRGDPG